MIYPYDDRVYPTKHKMWVCVSRQKLWFLRINSKQQRNTCVLLRCSAHPFLEHDSYLGCDGDLIQVAEAELELLLGRQEHQAKQGIIGHIDDGVRSLICEALQRSGELSRSKLNVILSELDCDQDR